MTGGGRLSSLVMTETGDVPAILDEAWVTAVHNQAEAGAPYFAHFPWTAEAGGDLGRL